MVKAKLVVLILLCNQNLFKYTIASVAAANTHGPKAGTCADIIELDSKSEADQIQKPFGLLGTYVKQERTFWGWEVYKRSCIEDLYLYRYPGQTDWLFGRWSGDNIGWVKHLSCDTCPENCPRIWVYWDPSRTQWYYDYSIRVTAQMSEDHCFRTWYLVFPVLVVLVCICACCCRKSDRDIEARRGGQGVGGARVGKGGAKPTGGRNQAGGKNRPVKKY